MSSQKDYEDFLREQAADAVAALAAETAEPAADVEHMFQPFVCVLRRPDGRYTIDLDWSDAYLGENTEDGWDDRGNGQDAQNAVDAWRKTQPATYTIPAAAAAEDDDERSFLDVADDNGWSDATILDVALDFISGRFLDPELIAPGWPPTSRPPEPEPERIATFNLDAGDLDEEGRPSGIPASAWPHIVNAAVTGRATGSVGARTTDPATGIGYRIVFRKGERDGIPHTTPVADVYLWSGE